MTSHRNEAAIFRRVREIAQSDCELRHVRLHGSTRLPLDGFPLNLVLNSFFLYMCRAHSSLIKFR